jgi:hypothetical protein
MAETSQIAEFIGQSATLSGTGVIISESEPHHGAI